MPRLLRRLQFCCDMLFFRVCCEDGLRREALVPIPIPIPVEDPYSRGRGPYGDDRYGGGRYGGGGGLYR
eukprot:44500-Eustigmatos_ZCMA.PRE.1